MNNSRTIINKLYYISSIILLIVFVISLLIDYTQNYAYGSAPFYVYVLVRFVEFVIPAVLLFVVAKVLEKKTKK